MTPNKYSWTVLGFLLALSVGRLAAAEKAVVPVPATPAQMMNLPETPKPVVAPSPRIEIEQLWADGQKKQAEKKLTAWMDKEKSSPWPWVTSARMRYEEKNFKKCISLAQTAIEKSPACGEAYYWRGRGYENTEKLLEAANEYRAAVIAKQPFPDAEVALGRVQVLLGVVNMPTDK